MIKLFISLTDKLMIKLTLFPHFCGFTLSCLLFSCAGNYQTSTNLDKKHFVEYFAASKVKIYQSDNELPSNNTLINIVEGQDCQLKPHLAAPTEINARTDARKKAFQLGANAIVFSSCALIEDKTCHALLMCYGKAYNVEQKQ